MVKISDANLPPRRSSWRVHLDRLLPTNQTFTTELDIGSRLQALRKARRLSQRELAELSGLNFNTLSLIENDKSSPNVSTLQQLADALEVPVTAFFEVAESERQAVIFQKSGARPHVEFEQGNFSDLGGGMTLGNGTPLLFALDPHQDSGNATIVHTGQEFIYCLSGELIYWVEGRAFGLSPGDSLIFDAHLPHRWANPSDEITQAVMVICPADRDDRSVTQHLPPA